MSNQYISLSREPLILRSTRVWRTYTGGKMLEGWQGITGVKDGEFPEEWVASVIKARNVGREDIADEGLSKIGLKDGTEVYLKEVIAAAPQAFLGKGHSAKYNSQTAVLVKVLDSCQRLSIQVHPDPQFARNVFHSRFGKTEAWYILGGRNIDGEPPYVLVGFKPGITQAKWRELFDKQDISGMIDCLHRIPVTPGAVFLIEGGVPHAIGPGCFMVEIQEPTDYTIRVERFNAEGKPIPDEMCHQGIGFEQIFDCFHYQGYSLKETLSRWQLPGTLLDQGDGYRVITLAGKEHTDKFGLQRLEISGAMACQSLGSFSIIIVINGAGCLAYPNGTAEIRQSQMLFLPAGLTEFIIESDPGETLIVLRCFPPQ